MLRALRPTIARVAVLLIAAGVLGIGWMACCGQPASAPANPPATASAPAKMPRLVDLGAKTCIPCKMMAPILEALKKDYAGRLQVDFIDVRENPQAGKPYGIKLIPTQIFYDADGKELFRHEGFFSRDEILAKWKELGVSLGKAGS